MVRVLTSRIPIVVTGVTCYDVRFPTSAQLDGSDAINLDPDYSAAYVVVHTNAREDLAGYGFTFTIGRGNEVCVAAIEALAARLVGFDLRQEDATPGAFYRVLTSDSQLRWLGPDAGVLSLAAAALGNAMWDLMARRAKVPLWRLLSGMTPEQLVGAADLSYMQDAISTEEAIELLSAAAPGRVEREEHIHSVGYPAYTTSPGWLGYSDSKLEALTNAALAAGFDHVKLKVGRNLDDDRRRCAIARGLLGPDRTLSIDANQRWSVAEAISWVGVLKEASPYWIEEPTHPHDVLGHLAVARSVAPIKVATGEHAPNRVIFKQLLISGAIGVCQIDAARMAGVNEVLGVLLLAAKLGVPVCPHAGGVGLCELVQHLSVFDYVAVSGSLDGRWVEYVDHLHEHFTYPVTLRSGRYQVPVAPGYSTEMKRASLAEYSYPGGPAWAGALA